MNPVSFIRMQCVTLLLFMLSLGSVAYAQPTITIGFNLPLSGPRKAAAEGDRLGAEMVRSQINAAGGLKIGDTLYKVEYVYADNESSPQQAVNASLKLITKDNVLGVIGPLDSSRAIPAGAICESFKTPMVSPTSTNPKTTLNRPFVFRACFLDNFQGEVMANFAINELKAKKAAVLYNISDAYPRGLAEFFKKSFEAKQGAGSVIFENFLTSEKDLSAHLDKIVASGADVLFVPQYDDQIPGIVKQARARGWTKDIMGGDAWETSDLMKNCGDLCKGLYFSSHFAAIGAKGKSRIFVDQYQKEAKVLPTGDGALGYDSAQLLLTAIGLMDSLNPNLMQARNELKNKLAVIKGFEGVSGNLDMNADGNPAKSAVVIRINEKGEFELFKTVNP